MPVRRFLARLGIPASTWYYWRQASLEERPARRWPAPVVDAIEEQAAEKAYRFSAWGHRKIWAMLRADGASVSQSSVKRALARRGLLMPVRYQAERRQLAKARRATFEAPPRRRNRVWQTDFSEFETAAGGTWRITGVVNYAAKVCLAVACSGTQTARDAVSVLEAAIAEAERLLERELEADCRNPETGELHRLVIVSDNGPAYKSDRFSTFISSRPELSHVRTRHRSPETNGVIERFYESLKYEHLYRLEIPNGHALGEELELYRALSAREPRLPDPDGGISGGSGAQPIRGRKCPRNLTRAAMLIQRGQRVVISVFGKPSEAPLDAKSRTQYCDFLRYVFQRIPFRDVAIWNEANSPQFWPQTAGAAAYEELLSACWRRLHALRRDVNLISTTAAHYDPAGFVRALGDAYRARGRKHPILDTFGHNPYPDNAAEPPWVQHDDPRTVGQGDLGRLLRAIETAFEGTAQPLPGEGRTTVWYLETGFQTTIPKSKKRFYRGEETDPFVVPPVAPEGSKPWVRDQASQLRDALLFARCQPEVGAFFNFELLDEDRLAGWQSGVLWRDGTEKASYDAFKAAVRLVRSGEVDCSTVTGVPGSPPPPKKPDKPNAGVG